MKTRTPTLEQFAAYQAAYDYFNRVLFARALKPCLLNFRSGNFAGLFAPERWNKWSDKILTHEITLNPDILGRPLKDTMATLVHEMVHQWQQDCGTPPRAGYHDKEWARKMTEIGLIPSDTGAPGGKQTGQRVTHYVEARGAFERAYKAMPDAVALPWLSGGLPGKPKPKSKNKSKTKYLCPECATPVWGKAGLNLLCMDCDQELVEEIAVEEEE